MSRLVSLHPNETKCANVTISNVDSMDAYATLTVTVIDPTHFMLNAKLSVNELLLASYQTQNITMTVTAPARGRIVNHTTLAAVDIVVYAVSSKYPGTSDSVKIRLYIEWGTRFLLACPDRVHTTSNGYPTAYELYLTNVGNTVIDVVLAMKGPPSWYVRLNRTTVTGLPPGSCVGIEVRVASPVDTQCDEVGVVVVNASSIQDPGIVDEVTLHTVTCCLAMWLEAPELEKYIEPGGEATFNISVRFCPVCPDAILKITPVEPIAGWSFCCSIPGDWRVASMPIPVSVSCPLGARPGENFTLNVSLYNSIDMCFGSALLVASAVAPHADVPPLNHSLSLKAGWRERTCPPGGTLEFPFSLWNDGNILENVTIGTVDPPPEWESWFEGNASASEAFYEIDPGERFPLTLFVRVPEKADGTTRTITVAASSASGIRQELSFSAGAELADLYISVVSYSPAELVEGRPTLVNVTVVNGGPWEANNVLVRCRYGNSLAGVERIWRLPAGSSCVVTFQFRPDRGLKTMIFVVDPDNLIAESNETNNVVKERLRAGPYPLSSHFPDSVVMMSIVTIAVIGMLLWRVLKRLR